MFTIEDAKVLNTLLLEIDDLKLAIKDTYKQIWGLELNTKCKTNQLFISQLRAVNKGYMQALDTYTVSANQLTAKKEASNVNYY